MTTQLLPPISAFVTLAGGFGDNRRTCIIGQDYETGEMGPVPAQVHSSSLSSGAGNDDTTQKEYFRKKGLCPTCGVVQTHKKRTSFKKGRKKSEPLTKEGEVYEGYCLKCNSLEDVRRKPDVIEREEKVKQKQKKQQEKLHSPEKKNHTNSSNSKKSSRKRSKNNPPAAAPPIIGTSSQTWEAAPSTCMPPNIEEILTNMTSDPENASVQSRGCTDLAKLAGERGRREEDQRHPSVVLSGDQVVAAIDAIVDAMNAHGNDVYVQEEGCRAIRRFSTGKDATALLCAGEDIETDVDICSSIAIQGGVLAVLSAMTNHRHSLHVQREGVRVLRNTLHALGDQNRTIIDHGGIEVTIRAMLDVNDKSATVQEDGCVVLWTLAYDDVHAQYLIEQHHGVSAILNAMSLYSKMQKVQHHGCGVLHTLSANQDLTERILDHGGFETIINAIKEHGYSADLTERACGALVNLTVHAEEQCGSRLCRMRREELGLISNAMDIHTTSSMIQRSVCYLLQVASHAYK